MTNHRPRGPSGIRSQLIAFAGLASALASAGSGCTPADTPSADLETSQSALVIAPGLSEATYLSICTSNGVPAPPAWGAPNIGTGAGKWVDRGEYTDTFQNGFNGHVYYTTTSAGICVINAHDGFQFDVICQGTNGKACFWEGNQPPAVPSTSVTLVPSGQWSFGQGLTPILSPESQGNQCTNCHIGQNVFITHFSAGHPLNLVGQTGWMPTPPAWMDPIGPASFPQNPDPGVNAYSAYPTSTCLSCHTNGGIGGRFPTMNGNPYNYCGIFAEVTNRPASLGGMPPTWPDGSTNNCTPGFNCARQVDPFVKAMLKNGCAETPWPDPLTARATAGTPAALYAYSGGGPSYTGEWEHVMADSWSGTRHENMLTDNRFDPSTGLPTGWNGPLDVSGTIPTPFQTSVWIKDPNQDGTNYAQMVTRYDGSIVDKGPSGTLRNINRTLAAGPPTPYLRHDGWLVAVYQSQEDSNIHEIAWNGSWFEDAPLPRPSGTFGALGDPIGYRRSPGSGGSSSVVWVCSGSGSTTTICEDRLVNGQWWSRSFTTAVKVKDDGMGDLFMPRPNNSGSGNLLIAYSGTDGVHVLLDPSEPWFGTVTDVLINTDTSVASGPVAYYDQNGYTNVVYRAQSGSTSSIIEVQGTSTGWVPRTVFSTTSETLTDDPAAFIAVGPWVDTIFFRTSAHKVYERQWSYAAGGYVTTTVF